MSFMSLTLNLCFSLLSSLPVDSASLPVWSRWKWPFCVLSFVWFPPLPRLVDESGDSRGLWRHVWIRESGTCVQGLGGAAVVVVGFAGSIVQEFRGLFFFPSSTGTLTSEKENLGCFTPLWSFKHQITRFFKQSFPLLCLREDWCWPLRDPETSRSKQMGVAWSQGKRQGDSQTILKQWQKSRREAFVPPMLRETNPKQHVTVTSGQHWCLSKLYFVFSTRCVIVQDFGRNLAPVCYTYYSLKGNAAHTWHTCIGR